MDRNQPVFTGVLKSFSVVDPSPHWIAINVCKFDVWNGALAYRNRNKQNKSEFKNCTLVFSETKNRLSDDWI